ncbi:hypothetical protein F5X68DRAFT_260341 [Plectosphaerella plurivora]|uniref:Uncharacterized protein n=1 Tax=Plectosphaerella plurivora TaxID=936078 RepID=A0A9P8VDQ9_9PEZI|nr:hypothetical protein F5X68DRAFT_260341 [Plectosphaerella plurivora]
MVEPIQLQGVPSTNVPEVYDGDINTRAVVGSSSDIHGEGKRKIPCPYYLHDPHNHVSCIGFSFTRISDLFQHFRRCHELKDPYCAFCWMKFKKEEVDACDSHIRSGECQQKPRPDKFMTDVQCAAIKKLSRTTKVDIGTRSMAIFKSLFRSDSLPDTPFIYGDARDRVDEVKRMLVIHQSDLPILDDVLWALDGLKLRLEELKISGNTGLLQDSQSQAAKPLEFDPDLWDQTGASIRGA